MKIYGPGFVTITGVLSTGTSGTEGTNATGTSNTSSYELIQIDINDVQVREVSIVYTNGSMMASLGHTLMRFVMRRGSHRHWETIYYSYGLGGESLTDVIALTGQVIGAEPALYFGSEDAAYGTSNYDIFTLRSTRQQRMAMLRFWLAVQADTPRYTFTQTNCASLIIDMLQRYYPRLRGRPHRWGRDPVADVPMALCGALRVEFDYSREESRVTDFVSYYFSANRYRQHVHSRRVRYIPEGAAPSMHGQRGDDWRRRGRR